VLQAAQNVRKRSGARLRTTCSSEPRPATRTAAPSSGDHVGGPEIIARPLRKQRPAT
jgi:hypothetical protein